MSDDEVRRGAARTATLVAVPLALVVLGVSVLVFGDVGTDEPAPVATGPVAMEARELAPEVAAACQLLVANLPDTVAGRARRPVTQGAEQNAAYGDPAITLECGTALPAVGLTEEVFNLAPPGENGGVCWYPAAGGDATRWTTVDRQVAVTVTVPGASEGSAQSVVPFSAAVGANLPVRAADEIPTGCSATPPTN
jgi:hypothetical protein